MSIGAKTTKQCNFVQVSNEDLDRKLNFWLENSFDESRHNEIKAMT